MWFPVSGIISKECRPAPFSYIAAFVWIWMGSFSHCRLSGGSEFVFMWEARAVHGHVHHTPSFFILLSVPVILHAQLVLSPGLWPFLPQVPGHWQEGRRGVTGRTEGTDMRRETKRMVYWTTMEKGKFSRILKVIVWLKERNWDRTGF